MRGGAPSGTATAALALALAVPPSHQPSQLLPPAHRACPPCCRPPGVRDIEGSLPEGVRIEYPIIADPGRDIAKLWGARAVGGGGARRAWAWPAAGRQPRPASCVPSRLCVLLCPRLCLHSLSALHLRPRRRHAGPR